MKPISGTCERFYVFPILCVIPNQAIGFVLCRILYANVRAYGIGQEFLFDLCLVDG